MEPEFKGGQSYVDGFKQAEENRLLYHQVFVAIKENQLMKENVKSQIAVSLLKGKILKPYKSD